MNLRQCEVFRAVDGGRHGHRRRRTPARDATRRQQDAGAARARSRLPRLPAPAPPAGADAGGRRRSTRRSGAPSSGSITLPASPATCATCGKAISSSPPPMRPAASTCPASSRTSCAAIPASPSRCTRWTRPRSPRPSPPGASISASRNSRCRRRASAASGCARSARSASCRPATPSRAGARCGRPICTARTSSRWPRSTGCAPGSPPSSTPRTRRRASRWTRRSASTACRLVMEGVGLCVLDRLSAEANLHRGHRHPPLPARDRRGPPAALAGAGPGLERRERLRGDAAAELRRPRRGGARPLARPRCGDARSLARPRWPMSGAMRTATDVTVIGGGLLGASIAYGLARAGASVAVLDEGDIAHRASRGNFALVWVQSKGLGMPEYSAWSRRSAGDWRGAGGGAEAGQRHRCRAQPARRLLALPVRRGARAQGRAHAPPAQPARRRRHRLGSAGSRGDQAPAARDRAGRGRRHLQPLDGHVNSLRLFRALHVAMGRRGVTYRPAHPVERIECRDGRFVVRGGWGEIGSDRVVLAAGLGNARLGADCRASTCRSGRASGQMIVTEKAAALPALSGRRPAPDRRGRRDDRRQPGGARLRHGGDDAGASRRWPSARCACSRASRSSTWCAPGRRCGS